MSRTCTPLHATADRSSHHARVSSWLPAGFQSYCTRCTRLKMALHAWDLVEFRHTLQTGLNSLFRAPFIGVEPSSCLQVHVSFSCVKREVFHNKFYFVSSINDKKFWIFLTNLVAYEELASVVEGNFVLSRKPELTINYKKKKIPKIAVNSTAFQQLVMFGRAFERKGRKFQREKVLSCAQFDSSYSD